MFVSLKKKLFLSTLIFAFTSLFAVLSTFLWIYFTSSVDKITKHYPQVSLINEEVIVKWSKKKPSNWSDLKEISEFAKWSIVVKEDWTFYQHEGIDLRQIFKALRDHFKKGKKLRGASTISQQLVKNLFLDNSRSFWRKAKELIYTYKVEKKYSKEKILETYLNVIEFGKNLYGIKNAARFYFNKNPINLSPKESAFLSMLLPSPIKYSYSFRKKELTEYAKYEIDRVLIKLRMANIYKEEDRLNAIKECFDWEINCNPLLIKDRLSERTENPGPIIKSSEGGEDTHKLQQ